MIRWKRSWPDLSESAPVDVLPCSNGEFFPKDPTPQEVAVMRLADEQIEKWRRKFNMPRRRFVRTAAAYSIGFWAINQIYRGRFGFYADAHNTDTTAACDLQWDPAKHMSDPDRPYETLANLPGEFIFDVQSHHVESDGMWRVTNPAFEAFFAAIWSQAGPLTGAKPGVRSGGSTTPGSSNFIIRGGGAGEVDPIENLSRFHYLKELFLDSATTMTVLSAVPAAPDITQPLPLDRAALTVETVNELANSQRTVLHAFVMPNRGSAGTIASSFGREPLYMRAEFELMEQRAVQYGHLIRGWKTYCPWGDIPYASGWFFDDELVGQPFIEQVLKLSKKYGLPPNIATHKGFALPGFDSRAASPRDIGPAASRNPEVNFIVYHSGYDGETMGAYGGAVTGNSSQTDAANGDATVNSADRTVSSLIKSLRENNWDATRFAGSNGFGNVPNVWAEIGSTWRSVMGNPNAAAHLLGKLIKYVGPKRICWGTDSLWFGSPHSEIVGLRKLTFSQELNDFYGLAKGLDSDAEDPTQVAPTPDRTIRNWIFGRAAAVVYRVDADAHANDRANWPKYTQNSDGSMGGSCDDVQKIRDGYVLNQFTPKEEVPMASNTLFGARTRRELIKMRREMPWGP